LARVPEASQKVAPSGSAPVFQTDGGANRAAFGATVADAYSRLGQTGANVANDMAGLALKIQTEDNERVTKELDVKYGQSWAVAGSGDGTTDNQGYYATKGMNAVEAYDGVLEAQKKARQKITEGVTNKRVLQSFGLAADARDANELKVMGRHVSNERVVAQDQTSQARIDLAVNGAAVGWVDPTIMDASLAIINGEADNAAKRKGLTPEATEAFKLQETTKAVTGAFHAALAAGDTVSATDLLNSRAGLVDGVSLAGLRGELRTEVITVASQTLADEAFKLFPGDQLAALEYIRDQTEGELEDKSVVQYLKRVNEHKNVRDEQRAATADGVREALEERPDIAFNLAEDAEAASPTLSGQLQHVRKNSDGLDREAAEKIVKGRWDVTRSEDADTRREIIEGRQDLDEEIQRRLIERPDEAASLADAAQAAGGSDLDQRKYIKANATGLDRDAGLEVLKARQQALRADVSEVDRLDAVQRAKDAEALASDAQEVVAKAWEKFPDPAQTAERREFADDNSNGKIRNAAKAVLRADLSAARGDTQARRGDAAANLSTDAQNVVQAALAENPEATPRQVRIAIKSSSTGDAQREALREYQLSLNATESDRSTISRIEANARALTNQQFAEDERDRVATQRTVRANALAVVQGGGDWRSMAAPAKDLLTLQERAALDAYALQVANPKPPHTYDRLFLDIMGMSVEDLSDPNNPAVNLTFLRPKLNDQQFSIAQARIAAAQDPKAGQAASIFSETQMLNARRDELGYKLSSKDDKRDWAHITVMFQEQVLEADKNNGSTALTDADKMEILHKITDTVAVPNAGFWDANNQRFGMIDVPDEDRAAILRHRPDATAFEITQAYLAKKRLEQ